MNTIEIYNTMNTMVFGVLYENIWYIIISTGASMLFFIIAFNFYFLIHKKYDKSNNNL